MIAGEGTYEINKKPLDDYFDRETSKMIIKQPTELTETTGKYNITVKVHGGGINSQAGAIRHGISKALFEIDAEFRSVLKKAGFLTRDSRKKERKKYGQRKARAKFQFSKR
jgi:small subunit ribosomal protein S9